MNIKHFIQRIRKSISFPFGKIHNSVKKQNKRWKKVKETHDFIPFSLGTDFGFVLRPKNCSNETKCLPTLPDSRGTDAK